MTIDKQSCTGCGACKQICPVKSITMSMDEYGFLYPGVNSSCTNCGKCLSICPSVNHSIVQIPDNKPCYMLTAKNKALENNSASGGFCATLAVYFIEHFRAVVFGCTMTDEFIVCHEAVTRVEDVGKIQGSKYVQSDTLATYQEAKKALDANRYVLYMGTPCQIAGLKAFLQHSYLRLTTVDIICHGVPSMHAFQGYINYLSQTAKSPVAGFRFRNKTRYERTGYVSKTKHNHGKVVYRKVTNDIFFYLFSRGKSYRYSCYHCIYPNLNREGDFTCGDCGSRKYNKSFMPYEATSTLIFNTERALSLWNDIKHLFEFMPIDIKLEAKENKQLHECTAQPSDRDEVCRAMIENKWRALSERYLPKTRISMKNIISTHIPISIKQKLFKIVNTIKRA